MSENDRELKVSYEEILNKALRKGDIIYDMDSNENTYPVLKKHLPEIINRWENAYPEIKEKLSDWKNINIDGKLDLSEPIKSYNDQIFRDMKVLNVHLEICPNQNPEKINCSETCVEYKFKIYHDHKKHRLIRIVEKGCFYVKNEENQEEYLEHLEDLIKEKENLKILFNNMLQ